MSKKPALGRGFEGLIPTNFNISDVASPGEQIKQVLLTDIVVNPDQPRKEFDETALKELSESIKSHGIIQPLIVTPQGEKYRIVAGERRYRASILADYKKVPVIVRNHKELEEIEIALVENVQRVDLSPLETAVSIVRLRDQFSLTPKQIATKLGKAETTISNIIRLLQLPKSAVIALQKGDISEGHARAILALKSDGKIQEKLLEEIIKNKLSVRQAEAFVKDYRKTLEQKSSSVSKHTVSFIESVKNRGINVRLQEKKQGGSLIFDYKNEKELKIILDQIKNI